MGANHKDAVSLVCISLLDKSETYGAGYDPGLDRTHVLMLSNNYCKAYLERWPYYTHSGLMAGALETYENFKRAGGIAA